MKLKFIGWQDAGQGLYLPMWNVFNSPKPWLHPDGSTVSLMGWRELL